MTRNALSRLSNRKGRLTADLGHEARHEGRADPSPKDGAGSDGVHVLLCAPKLHARKEIGVERAAREALQLALEQLHRLRRGVAWREVAGDPKALRLRRAGEPQRDG
jgi:hypothetical protein